MHYVTRQKHMFDVTCRIALCVGPTLGPPRKEKECIDVSCHGQTRISYMTHRSYRIQKHKFGASCPDTLFVGSALDTPKLEKIVH
jgi:hypothetical protein